MRVSRRELWRRVRAVRRLYESCRLCPHDCGVDRWSGQTGVCGLGRDAHWYRELLHLGEERQLVPSHVIYLSGCNLRCAFCSDGRWVRSPRGDGTRRLGYRDMARRVAQRRSQGARNVNLVGGTPDVNLYAALRLLAELPGDTHVVWNSNLWTTEQALDLLDGAVDTYLADLKFGDDACAERLSGARGYTARLRSNLRQAASQAELVVRHLALPGHLDCCTRPALTWLREELPGATVNLMTGYVPFDRMGRPGGPERMTTPDERRHLAAFLRGLRFPRALLDGDPLPGNDAPPAGR